MSLLGHIQHLAETIGPRGSTTENEAKAADYVAEQLSALGVQPACERFLSRTSTYSPYIVATGGALLGIFLFWQPQPVGAAAAVVIILAVLASLVRELALQDNPLRWIVPTEYSQNVSVTFPGQNPKQPPDPPILVTAHIDTHRTPLFFSSRAWQRLFGLLMPISLACTGVLLVLFVIGIVSDARLWRQIALVPGVLELILFALFLQATRSPFTPGANDNASGVAVALDLAERLHNQPLTQHDVILAFTGCEEVGGYGADAFITTHRDRLQRATHLVIDHVGGHAGQPSGPSVICSERFFQRIASDPGLVRLAKAVIAGHPDLMARTADFDQAFSELSIGAAHGLPVIGLMALMPDGTLPNWHVPSDTTAHIDEATVQHAADFVWHFLLALDADHQRVNADLGAA